MPLVWILASMLGGAYTAEKVGDFINEKRGVAPQPIYGGPAQPQPAGLMTVGAAALAGAAVAWWLAKD